MRALAYWREQMICPLCGWPKEICQDTSPEVVNRTSALPPERCNVTTVLRAAQKHYADQPGANPEGLLWRAEVRS